MVRVILLVILSSALALSGCSAKTVVADETPTKVDVQQVLATGEVKPVKGITPAGQPDAAALKVFSENGYAAVIDLRTVGVESWYLGQMPGSPAELMSSRNDVTFELDARRLHGTG